MASKHQTKRRTGVRKRGPAQRKLGRPGGQSKFEKVDASKLMAEIAKGVPVEIACTAAGIHRDTFYHWLDNRPDFAQALAAEKRAVILEALAAVKVSTKDSEYRGWAWFLERVYKDHFAPPDRAPHINLAQNTLNLVDGQVLEEARQILDAAKALPYRSEENG